MQYAQIYLRTISLVKSDWPQKTKDITLAMSMISHEIFKLWQNLSHKQDTILQAE